jgi:polyisoprenoid-binding protein YceI
MKHALPLLSLASLLAIIAVAEAAAGISLDSVKVGRYRIEAAHTQVGFSISHFGFTNYSGLFAGARGNLQLDPAHPAANRLEVDIPVDSIVTTIPKLTDLLKGEQWFDAAKFPQASFSSTDISFGPKGEITISGNLTLHGVTKPVTLHAHLVGAGVNPLDKQYTVGFEARGAIKRTDFGVSLYAPALGDEVELKIAGAFELEG